MIGVIRLKIGTITLEWPQHHQYLQDWRSCSSFWRLDMIHAIFVYHHYTNYGTDMPFCFIMAVYLLANKFCVGEPIILVTDPLFITLVYRLLLVRILFVVFSFVCGWLDRVFCGGCSAHWEMHQRQRDRMIGNSFRGDEVNFAAICSD